jgi:hypothetical protein
MARDYDGARCADGVKPHMKTWARAEEAHNPVEAAEDPGWRSRRRPGGWRPVTRRFRDGTRSHPQGRRPRRFGRRVGGWQGAAGRCGERNAVLLSGQAQQSSRVAVFVPFVVAFGVIGMVMSLLIVAKRGHRRGPGPLE